MPCSSTRTRTNLRASGKPGSGATNSMIGSSPVSTVSIASITCAVMYLLSSRCSTQEVNKGRLDHLGGRREGDLVGALLQLHVGDGLGEVDVLDIGQLGEQV